MIRINLLGIPKTRRGKRASMAAAPSGQGTNTVVLALIVFAITGAGLWILYSGLNREHDRLKSDLQAAIAENQRLALVKSKYEASKLKAEQFERRVKVIDHLRQEQSGPVDLLNLVAETISSTDAVWLNTMTDDGRNIDLTGMALNPDAVADLMTNLQKTKAFKTVEIKEALQESATKDLQTFKFELICEKSQETKK